MCHEPRKKMLPVAPPSRSIAGERQRTSLRIVSLGRFWFALAAVFLIISAFLLWCSVHSGYQLGHSRGPLLASGPHDGVMEGRSPPGSQLDPCRDLYEYVCHNWSSPHGARTFGEDVARSWERLVEQAALAQYPAGERKPVTTGLAPEYAVDAVRQYHNSCMNLLEKTEKDLRSEVLRLFVALNSSWEILQPDPLDEGVVRLLLLLSLRFGLQPVLRTQLRVVGGNRRQLQVEPSKAPLPGDHLPDGATTLLLSWCAIYMRSRLSDEDMTGMAGVLRDLLSVSSRASFQRGALRSPEVLAHLAPSVPAHIWISAATTYAGFPVSSEPPGVLVRAVSTVRSVLSVLLKPHYREMALPFLLVQSFAAVLRMHVTRVMANGPSSNVIRTASSDHQRCLSLSRRVLAPIWNVLYSEAIADQRFAPLAKALVHELKLKLRSRVRASSVLDGESRATADRKLAAVRAVFPKDQNAGGYRPRDLPGLGRGTGGGGFLAHTMTALAFLQRVRRSSERAWLLTRQQSPRVRLTRDNELCVPAAQLRAPFATGFPFLDLATLGAMASQQMLQAVGERGSRVDDTGTARDWWTDKTRQQMWQYVLCLRQVYLSGHAGGLAYPDADVWDQLGSAILGLQTAFEVALLNRPTAESGGGHAVTLSGSRQGPLSMIQRFFVRFCRGYCERHVYVKMNGSGRIPGRWVCNAAAQHLPAFADAFGCPDEAPMLPKEVCDGF